MGDVDCVLVRHGDVIWHRRALQRGDREQVGKLATDQAVQRFQPVVDVLAEGQPPRPDRIEAHAAGVVGSHLKPVEKISRSSSYSLPSTTTPFSVTSCKPAPLVFDRA